MTQAHSGTTAPVLRSNLILKICCLSLLLVGMDVTIVNVALPAIQVNLHAGMAGLQWVIDGYTLVVASLLMFSGAMSDRFGRRRVFQTGLTLFTLGSLLCSLAHTLQQLVAYRALQGLGASMLNPVALSIVANVFPEPKARARAVGIWGAVAGISLALGPLIGGALTQAIGWRSIFWINVPIGIAAVILAAIFVPESRSAQARAFDPLGQFLIFTALVSLTTALIEGREVGWSSPLIISLFAVGLAAVLGFVIAESVSRQPLVDLRFFRSIPFSMAVVLGLSAFASFAGFLFLNTLYLQQVRHLSAFRTGLCTLPLAFAMMVCAPLSGRLVGNRGLRLPLLISGSGFLLSALLLTHLSAGTPLAQILIAYALFGIGLGMVNPPIANSAVAGMPLSQAGVAAAIASTSRQVGAALGVAVAGTVAAAAHRDVVHFAEATHPVWWAMTTISVVILMLGFISNAPWVLSSAERVKAELIEGAAANK